MESPQPVPLLQSPLETDAAEPQTALEAQHFDVAQQVEDEDAVVEAQSLLGRPVFDLSQGKEVGSVKDVLFDPDSERLTGFNLDLPGFFSGSRRVPFSAVRGLGKDAITLHDGTSLEGDATDPQWEEAVKHGHPVIGKRIMTETGTFLGSVDDLVIQRSDGKVLGYRISGGMFKDAMKGAHYLPLEETLVVGEHVITVPDRVEAYVQTEVGGLKPALASLQDGAAHAVEVVKEKAGLAAEAVKEGASDLTDRTKAHTKDILIGKTAGHDVIDDAGNLLVGEGDVIAPEAVERAEASGKLMALSSSAVAAGAKSTWEQTKEAASGALQAGKEQVQGAQDRTREVTKEKLVGQKAGQSVSTEDGALLVEEGETLTAEIVDRADRAGRLAALSASVAAAGVKSAWETMKETVSAPVSVNVEEANEREVDAPVEGQKSILSQGTLPESLVGRRVVKTILLHDGSVLIPEGNLITSAISERAEAEGQLLALSLAVEAVPEAGLILHPGGEEAVGVAEVKKVAPQ